MQKKAVQRNYNQDSLDTDQTDNQVYKDFLKHEGFPPCAVFYFLPLLNVIQIRLTCRS